MSRPRRLILSVLGVLVGLPGLGVVAYLIWRPIPPPGAPRIGLSMASNFVVQRPAYEAALARAGGAPVLLTPTDDAAAIDAMLDRVSALLLSGGSDVAPALYEDRSARAIDPDPRRDRFEIALIRGAIQRGMPVLGICRGIQMLNVAHGGGIRNLRSDTTLSDRHDVSLDSLSAHTVRIEPGSKLAGVLGAVTKSVTSFHGQAVGRVGEGLRVCALAEDGVVEGVERPDRAFVMGVQWHPEIASLADDAALALFHALVHHAEAYRRQRAVTSADAAPAPTATPRP